MHMMNINVAVNGNSQYLARTHRVAGEIWQGNDTELWTFPLQAVGYVDMIRILGMAHSHPFHHVEETT